MDSPLAELDAWWSNKGPDEYESETILTEYAERDETVRITFVTVGGEDTAYLERAEWRLEIKGYEEAAWCHQRGGHPEWFESHILLAPFDTDGALISFVRPFNDPLRAWGAVAKAHHALVGDWFPLERFFRTGLLCASFGQLASGPARLLGSYAEALRSVGEEVGYAPHTQPWRAKDPALTALTWGESYFVARNYRLERRN